MNLSRRAFGSYAAGLLAASALAGCISTAGATVEVAAIEGYVQDVINGITALTAAPSITALLSQTNLTAAGNAVADAEIVLAQIKAAASTVLVGTAQGWAAQIETDVNAVVDMINAVPGIPATALAIVDAINALLPVLLASVQLSLPTKAAPGPRMSVQEAEAILQHPKV